MSIKKKKPVKSTVTEGMISVKKLKVNPDNPRTISEQKLKKLAESIKNFPEMMEKRPIVIDSWKNPVILGGNQRFTAILQLGMKEIPEKWVETAEGWSEEKKKEFLIKDNVSAGEFDWEVLSINWNVDQVKDWGINMPDFSTVAERKDTLIEANKTHFLITCPIELKESLLSNLNAVISEFEGCTLLNSDSSTF